MREDNAPPRLWPWILVTLCLLLVGLLVACGGASPTERTVVALRAPYAGSGTAMLVQTLVPSSEPFRHASVARSGPRDWCEPVHYDTLCQTEQDCVGLQHVSGRPLKCVQPWWAKGTNDKICAPGAAGRTERAWRRARQREVIAQLHFDESALCPAWRWEIAHERKRVRFERVFESEPSSACKRAGQRAQTLADFLWAPYLRETTARPWKRHRLNPDQAAAERAWARNDERYGWDIRVKRLRKREAGSERALESATPISEVHNRYYDQMDRWQYGLGSFGMNAAFYVATWSPLAPPEILCLEPQANEVYLRKARHAVKVLRGDGVECGGVRYHGRAIRDGRVVAEPSWMDAHRLASGGKYCPTSSFALGEGFRRRLKSVGINPDTPIHLADLGSPLPRQGQDERAMAVLDEIDRKLPVPW